MESVEERLKVVRLKLILKYPFYGYLLSRMPLAKADPNQIPTMATDGRKIYYCEEFVEKLDNDELLFVLGHEILHNVFDHFVRLNGRNAQYWNMATDYAINGWLKEDGVGKMPKIGLYDEKYNGLNAETIYNDLVQNNAQTKDTLDKHIIVESDSGNNNNDGSIQGSNPLTAKEISELRNAVITAKQMQQQANGAGDLAAGLERLIDDITESKLDWTEYLEKVFSESIKSNYTYARYNKRNYYLGVALPNKMNGDKIVVHIAVDASASVTEEDLKKFLGEVKGITEQYDDCEIVIWSFDGTIHNVQKYDCHNLDELEDYNPVGCGGTIFEVNWDFMKDPQAFEQDVIEKPIIPSNLIVFTDGMPCRNWGDEDYCNTIFAICGDSDIQAPFGQTIYVD